MAMSIKKLKKIISLITILSLVVSMCALPNLNTYAADTETVKVKLNPSDASPFNNGKFEGWGTSIGWWGNRVGYSDTLAKKTAELFYSDKGLGLDIARYNVGGGDDPEHNHVTRSDSKMPCFMNEDGTYNWDADHNQMNVLMNIKEQNNKVHIEGYTNSPPWFMTKSKCSGGGTNAAENLDPSMYNEFAAFVANVTEHFEEIGLKLDSYSPMNEPDVQTKYWSENSWKQEGNHVAPGANQSALISALKNEYRNRNIDTLVVGPEETSIDLSISSYNALTDTAKADLDRIDTHSYGGTKRAELKELAVKANKTLWMSEVDNGNVSGTNPQNMGMGLALAEHILADMNGMQPAAWVMWDILDYHKDSNFYHTVNGTAEYSEKNAALNLNGGLWGVGMVNHDTQEIELTQKYYVYGQFTKYINPGDTIIASSDKTLAAYNKDTGEIKIVAVNTSNESKDYIFDMSAFSKTGSTAKVIRTSGSYENGEHWENLEKVIINDKKISYTLIPNSVTTFVTESTGEATDYLYLSANTTSLKVGDTLKFVVSSSAANPTYKWSVDNADVASITDSGELIANAPGTVNVTVECVELNESRTFTVECIKWYKLTLTSDMISGTNSWNNDEATNYFKAVDSDVNTYFDGLRNGNVTIDLKRAYNIEYIGYAPRTGYEYRMLDGYFEVSEDGEIWENVYMITERPVSGEITTVHKSRFNSSFDTNKSVRYIRYALPDGQQSYNGKAEDYNCNIAEIEIYASPDESDVDYIFDEIEPDKEIRTNQYMPTEFDGASLEWETSNGGAIKSDGTVTRSGEDTDVTLTVKITKGNTEKQKSYTVTVVKAAEHKSEDDMEAYLFTHFVGTEETSDCEQVYFSVSRDGQAWKTLNNDAPVLRSTLGEGGVRDPHIIRSPEGDKFFLIATDLSIYNRNRDWGSAQTAGSKSIMIWESTDLVNWTDARLVEVSDKNAGCTWAPESVYDDNKGEYMVVWASKVSDDNYTYQRVYRSYTKDFEHFSEPEIYINKATDSMIQNGTAASVIDTTFIKHDDKYYRFTKDETKSSVTMMVGNDLSDEFTDVATYKLNNISGNTVTGYEGPTAYKLNGEDKWCLLLDFYSRSQGYKPFVTEDITAGEFVSGNDFSFDLTYRHGTVMPITLDEYDALVSEYGSCEIIGESSVTEGDSTDYSATVLGKKVNAVWSVNDNSLAIIDSNGKLTAKNSGTVTITAYVEQYKFSATKEVKIKEYHKDDITYGLVSYLSFDENGTGTGEFTSYNGVKVLERGTVSYKEGRFNNALNVDTHSALNYLELPDGILEGAECVSVSFWLKQSPSSLAGWAFMTTPVTGTQTYLSEKYAGILLDTSLTKITAERYYSDNLARPIHASVEGSFGEWNYITVVYSDDITKCYVNGQKITEESSDVDLTKLFTGSAKTWIGHANWGSGEGFSGMIDEFRLYSRELKDSEILTLYNMENPTVYCTVENDTVTEMEVYGGKLNMQIFIAQYGKDNTLQKINVFNTRIDGNIIDCNVDISGANSVKVFLWDSEMNPVLNVENVK